MEINLDKLLGGRVELFQPKQGFKATTDSVILAASIPFKQGERAIDLGSGLGVASPSASNIMWCMQRVL